MDSNISLETHINENVSKANSMPGFLRRTLLYLDEDIFNSLYKSKVRPHLEHANSVNVQQCTTKYVHSLKGLRLKKSSLPTLTYRHACEDMIEVYKILNIYDKEVCPNLSLKNQSKQGYCFKATFSFHKITTKNTQIATLYTN